MSVELKKFKKQDYKYNDITYALYDKPLDQVLTVGYNKPYLALGASEGGKSTLLLDAIVNNIDKVSKFWLFLPASSSKNESMQIIVDKCFIRELTWDNLYAVYNEIKDIGEQHNRDVGDLVNLATKLADTRSPEEGRRIRSLCQEMNSTLNNMQQLSVKYEVLARYILNCAPDPNELNESETKLIQSFLTPNISYMVIFDDVTTTLTTFKSVKEKVTFNGQKMSMIDAFNALINEWMTRARHGKNLTIISAHTADTFAPAIRKAVGSIIYCGSQAASENQRTFSRGIEAAASVMREIIAKDPGYKYYCSIYSDSNRIDESNKLSIVRASLHDNNTRLNYSKDLKQQLDIYHDVILNNVNNRTQEVENTDDNDPGFDDAYLSLFNDPSKLI